MKPLKWFVVWFLEFLCARLDAIPVPDHYEDGWRWNPSGWGCYPFHLAAASDRLDQRWHTGVWKSPPKE